MEFKEAMRIWKRVHHSVTHCRDCPVHYVCPLSYTANEVDESAIEQELIKWAEEHPAKTIADDFLEKLPKAVVWENGTPTACALDCGYGQPNICKRNIDICADCWRRPLEEVEG